MSPGPKQSPRDYVCILMRFSFFFFELRLEKNVSIAIDDMTFAFLLAMTCSFCIYLFVSFFSFPHLPLVAQVSAGWDFWTRIPDGVPFTLFVLVFRPRYDQGFLFSVLFFIPFRGGFLFLFVGAFRCPFQVSARNRGLSGPILKDRAACLHTEFPGNTNLLDKHRATQ